MMPIKPAVLGAAAGIAATVAAICAAVAGVFIYLYSSEVKDHARFRADVVAAQEQAERDAKERADRQAELLASYGNAWAGAMADKPPVIRVLRESSACLKPVPGLSATAAGNAGLSAGSGESRDIQTISIEQCEQLAVDSILDAKWIEQVKRLTNDLHEASK